MTGTSFIKPLHVLDFNAISSRHSWRNFRLTSCKVDGEPTVAIVRLSYVADGVMSCEPLFVWPNESMIIDIDGRRFSRRYRGRGRRPRARRPRRTDPPPAATGAPEMR